MNKRTIRLLALALPLCLLASCSKDDMETGGSEASGQNGNISFEIGFKPESVTMTGDTPQTRMTTDNLFNSAWEDGDEIGIFAVASGTPLSSTATANYINNVKLTYSTAGSGSWAQATPLYWPTTASGIASLDFYAYYPYDASATDPTAIAFNVMSNQNDATGGKSNYSLSDLLTAKANNNNNGYDRTTVAVPLTFSHALAMVQVSVPSAGKGFGPSENLVVRLQGVKAKATLDLTAINASIPGNEIAVPTTDNDAVDITMYRVEQNDDPNYEKEYTYRALVPAQTIDAGNNLFRFEHEDWKIFKDGALGTALSVVAGQAETFKRILPHIVQTVPIPAGTFIMGSPTTEPNREIIETQHQVTLTKNFRMSKYEVTNSQYAEFLNAISIMSDGLFDTDKYSIQPLIKASSGDYDWGLHWNETDNKWEPSNANSTNYSDYPVINVSWYGAMEYAKWVGGSLPTEAQWEYACRGEYPNKATETNTKPFDIGDGTKLTYDMANFDVHFSYDVAQGGEYEPTAGTVGKSSTTPVGFYSNYDNTYGLYDMHGNVMEWCLDSWEVYDYDTDPVTDPESPNPGDHIIVRGGYFNFGAKYCRSAGRYGAYPDSTSLRYGFRVVFVQ